MTTCVLVRYIDGTPDCWVSLEEYLTNPDIGSYIVNEHSQKVEPICKPPIRFEEIPSIVSIPLDWRQKITRKLKFEDLFPDK